MASCTLTYATAAAKPGSNGRPSATAVGEVVVLDRDEVLEADARWPGRGRSAPCSAKRSPPNTVVYPVCGSSWSRYTSSSFIRSRFQRTEPDVP